MANLPNKSFVFNYNARDYNPATFTIPKTSGQTMDRDMVWSATTTAIRNNIQFVNDDHISVPLSAYSLFDFTTSGENPMNNTEAAPAMTIIMKRRLEGYSVGANDISNRGPGSGTSGDYYNWMIRSDGNKLVLHTNSYNNRTGQYVSFSSGSVITYVIRVNNNRQIEIKNLTDGTSNTPFTSTWNSGSRWFSFFIWFHNGSLDESMSGDFYWAYASREVLTDEEIQQVIAFNESTFGPDTTGSTIAASGGTLTTNLESETGWTATTTSPWITISPASGESGTTVSFTVQKTLSQRTGVVTFTSDGGDTAEYTITQKGMEGIVPVKKIYKGTRRIN